VNLFSILTSTDEDEAWLKANKNKIKNELELMAYLAYRNAREE
jgi:hypothetical protein